MDAYTSTVQLVIVAAAIAGGGWAYFHFAGKAFDRKYGRTAPSEPHRHAASGE